MTPIGAALFSMALHAAPAQPPKGIAAESPETRFVRVWMWAEAADEAADGDRAAAAVIRVIHGSESRLAAWVHDGRIKGDCKPGKGCRATCLGSIHPWAKDWALLAGIDYASTVRCARRTLQAFRSGLAMCASGVTKRELRVALAFEYYARGSCATPSKESMRRAQWWSAVEARLWMVP